MKKEERIQYVKDRIWNRHFKSEQLFYLTIYLLILFISKHFCDKDAAHTHTPKEQLVTETLLFACRRFRSLFFLDCTLFLANSL